MSSSSVCNHTRDKKNRSPARGRLRDLLIQISVFKSFAKDDIVKSPKFFWSGNRNPLRRRLRERGELEKI